MNRLVGAAGTGFPVIVCAIFGTCGKVGRYEDTRGRDLMVGVSMNTMNHDSWQRYRGCPFHAQLPPTTGIPVVFGCHRTHTRARGRCIQLP